MRAHGACAFSWTATARTRAAGHEDGPRAAEAVTEKRPAARTQSMATSSLPEGGRTGLDLLHWVDLRVSELLLPGTGLNGEDRQGMDEDSST